MPTITPEKINMEPENGPLEHDVPLQPIGFQIGDGLFNYSRGPVG